MAGETFDKNKPQKFTIYDFPIATYPARVRIALHEKGMFQLTNFKLVNLFKGEQKAENYVKTKSISGSVPVLELEDGSLLSECTAITRYLDNLDGNPFLTGKTAFEMAHIDMMTRQVENEFLEPINLYIRNATDGFGKGIEKSPNREWGLKQRQKGVRGMYYFNDILERQPYICGDEFTMADIAAIGAILSCDFVQVKIPSECHGIKDWYTRVDERESVKRFTEESDTFKATL